MWSRAAPQDKNSICHCQYDDRSNYISSKAARASSIGTHCRDERMDFSADSYHWFFSDAGCIGLQSFLEDPMWSRASPQDKNSICHCQYDDLSEYFSIKADRASSILIVETIERTIVPLIQPLAFTCSDSYHWFFSMLCIVLTLSLYLQYIQ